MVFVLDTSGAPLVVDGFQCLGFRMTCGMKRSGTVEMIWFDRGTDTGLVKKCAITNHESKNRGV